MTQDGKSAGGTPPGQHPESPHASFDGGTLDCGSGLLLLIRKHIDPLAPGELLEIISRESSVREDLPAWCRLTGNELVSTIDVAGGASFLVRKAGNVDPGLARPMNPVTDRDEREAVGTPLPEPGITAFGAAPESRVAVKPAPPIPLLSVMGIGSWPRPGWMLRAIDEHLQGRLGDEAFEEAARDAVRLSVEAQLRAGADVLTDGEQRRDNYAAFVGALLENCQLIPVTDLLPYVDDPEEFARELRALDIPATRVRHPAVFGRISRTRGLALHELAFLRTLSDRPVKVALPGPYLLTRTMWMECISDRAYENREALARDIVPVLRDEIRDLLAAGASMVQLDEPVLSEVVFGAPKAQRTFMCGALGARLDTPAELAFARDLINETVAGFDAARLGLHMCRGNWTPDESVALSGDYTPLMPVLAHVNVGTLFLEMCTARAGELGALRGLPEHLRVGVGVVNQKHARIEPVEEIVARGEAAIAQFGAERVLLTPDCGFATFAENPVTSAAIAEAKLAAMSTAATVLRERHGLGG